MLPIFIFKIMIFINPDFKLFSSSASKNRPHHAPWSFSELYCNAGKSGP